MDILSWRICQQRYRTDVPNSVKEGRNFPTPNSKMASLYVKGKENGHVQAYAPTGAMGLKRWGGLTSKLDGLPIASDPHLWWQACP